MSELCGLVIAALDSTPSAVTLAAVGAALATTGVALLPLAAHLGQLVVPERRVFFARWGGRHLLLVVLAHFVSSLVVGQLAHAVWGPELTHVQLLAATALIYVLPVFLIVRSALQTEPSAVESLGLQASKGGAAALYGFGMYVLFLPAMWGVWMLWPWLYELLGGEIEAQSALTGFAELEGGSLVAAALLATLVLPFFEELVFRGFLQPFLVQNFHDRGGVILTSLIFAAVHGSSAFGPIFVLSLLLGGVALRTRRLWASWAAHAAHNTTILLLFLNYPELAQPPGGWARVLDLLT